MLGTTWMVGVTLWGNFLNGQEVSADRYEHLTPAVSVDLGQSMVKDPKKRRATSVSSDDFMQLATDGFQCVSFQFAFPEEAQNSQERSLLEAIHAAQNAGLSVILKPRSLDSPNISDRHLSDADLIRWLQKTTAQLSTDRTFVDFQDLCIATDAKSGAKVQIDQIAQYRTALPKLTFLVPIPGSETDLVSSETDEATSHESEALGAVPAYPDPNIVYTFGFNSPLLFVNQGLPNSQTPNVDRATVPYPGSLSSVATVIGSFDDRYRDSIVAYGRAKWNGEKIASLMKPFGEWARKHRVRMMIDDFGVSARASSTDRANYLGDVRTASSDNGIGWCVKEYVGPYGIFTGESGGRQAGPGLLSALGLSGG